MKSNKSRQVIVETVILVEKLDQNPELHPKICFQKVAEKLKPKKSRILTKDKVDWKHRITTVRVNNLKMHPVSWNKSKSCGGKLVLKLSLSSNKYLYKCSICFEQHQKITVDCPKCSPLAGGLLP